MGWQNIFGPIDLMFEDDKEAHPKFLAHQTLRVFAHKAHRPPPVQPLGILGDPGAASRPVPIVLVKCWKGAHWNAKKLLKNCQKSKKLLPKFQKLLPKFLAIFI